MGFLAMSLMATDFTQMTTQELTAMRGTVAVEDREAFRAEMQSRIANMTAEERATLKATRQATGQQLRDGSGAGKGLGQGKKGMGKRNMPTFADFDTDSDGKITQVELEAARTAKMTENAEAGKLLKNAGNAPEFSTLDTNGDGSLDATEFQVHQTTQMENRMNQMGGQGMQNGNRGQGQGMMQNIQQQHLPKP